VHCVRNLCDSGLIWDVACKVLIENVLVPVTGSTSKSRTVRALHRIPASHSVRAHPASPRPSQNISVHKQVLRLNEPAPPWADSMHLLHLNHLYAREIESIPQVTIPGRRSPPANYKACEIQTCICLHFWAFYRNLLRIAKK
jgi:hypothetical protein